MVIDGSKDFIDLTDLRLVLKEYASVKIRDLSVCSLADQLFLASMHDLSKLNN